MDAKKAALVAMIMVAGHFFLTLGSAVVNLAAFARHANLQANLQMILTYALHLGSTALLDGGLIIFFCFFRSAGNEITEHNDTNFEV